MTEHIPDDNYSEWYLRISCVIAIAGKECLCHLYVDPEKCERCKLLNSLHKAWPTEFGDAMRAIVTTKVK